MYDSSQVILRSVESIVRRIYQKLDVCLKFHESENTLFLTSFKITLLDIMFINWCKPTHHVLFVTSKIKITGIHSQKNFQKLDVCLKFHKSENALFLILDVCLEIPSM